MFIKEICYLTITEKYSPDCIGIAMKITLRLIVSLVVVAALVAWVFAILRVREEEGQLARELEIQASMLTGGLHEPIQELLLSRQGRKLKRLVAKFNQHERQAWLAVYDSLGSLLESTPGTPQIPPALDEMVKNSLTEGTMKSSLESYGEVPIHMYVAPIFEEEKVIGALAVFQDASHINVRLKGIWQNNFVRLLSQVILIIATTIVVVRWSITGPIAQLALWMRGLRLGKVTHLEQKQPVTIFDPLATEVSLFAKSLAAARATAEEEARLRLKAESVWTAERLKEQIRTELGDKTLYVVSNREPYMHVRQRARVECIVPAGGLVTALDPVMQACGGVWVAHGSGDADRESTDSLGKLRVPPEEPRYVLRRVWLTKEEEEGYYYGFSNEGIWPLCHITHTRPIFRLDDWKDYQNVNVKFSEAILEEIADEEAPVVLVQDYHFALLPMLIKTKRPDAHVGIFWHIPWPNPEAFGICPWKEELLVGLLNSDLIGFHIQFHCNNFLETVDRFIESKINWEQFSVERQGQVTSVKPFPISVAFPNPTYEKDKDEIPLKELREKLLKEVGVRANVIGVGVDRIDYTKGIVERCKAVERFLEKYPEYVGQFTFVELGAPSRTHIKRYHDLIAEIEESTDKINWRFQTRDWKPIVFLKGHHTHESINRWYKTADVCIVTSLHDGMNLVAKEFIAARDDEEGILIVSQFTGASRELQDALIVNPYDIEQVADTIHTALTMDQQNRRERMKRLREVLRERNVYRWAANLVTTLSRLRVRQSVADQQVEK